MSLEERVEILEQQLRKMGNLLQKAAAFIEQREIKDQATLDFGKTLVESAQAHEVRFQTLSEALVQHQADISLLALTVYFLMHALEQTEYVVPVGTVDSIMDSVEKSGDVKAAIYYELFQELREATAEAG